MSFLADNERARYARHLLLPEVGSSGQLALKSAKVLMIGMGGLGSPIALYLAAAGVGTLGLVDADNVDVSNMHRQILYGSNDIDLPKTAAAAARLTATNPHTRCVEHREFLIAANAESLLANYDLVIDGTDNFAAHYLINDACVLFKKPLIYASVARFNGYVSMMIPHNGPCYRCLYPTPPPPDFIPSCAESGVLGPLPGLVGLIQATEALKFILKIGAPLTGRLLMVDALSMQFKEMTMSKDPACPTCGDAPTITALHDSSAPGCAAPSADTITADQLRREMASPTPPFLLDVRNQDEFDEQHINGSHLIPLPVLPQRLAELDPTRDMVVHCRSGMRSAKAIAFLREQGFTRLRNLTGGIVAYGKD